MLEKELKMSSFGILKIIERCTVKKVHARLTFYEKLNQAFNVLVALNDSRSLNDSCVLYNTKNYVIYQAEQ